MKLMKPKDIRELTRINDPAGQVAYLRRHGLHPFVCPVTGGPVIFEEAVYNRMLSSPVNQGFEGNMEAFE